MSSFLITNKSIDYPCTVNSQLIKYGKDKTIVENKNNISLIYNFLVTEDSANNYYIYDDKEEIVCVYDGILFGKADILDLYKKYGYKFYKYLDGEYSIVILDKKNNLFLAYSDPFGSRHLSIGFDGDKVGASTFRHPLEALQFKNIYNVYGNTVFIIDLKTKKIDIQLNTIYDTVNPFKKDFNDWVSAFSKAVEKRIFDVSCPGLTLSDGFDSGMIHCDLISKNIPHNIFSHISHGKVDSINILYKRHKLHNETMRKNVGKFIFSKNKLTDTTFDAMYFEESIDYDAYTESFYNIFSNNKKRDLESISCIEQMAALSKNNNVILTGIEGDIHFFPFLKQEYNLNFSISDIARAARLSNGYFGLDTRFVFLDKNLYQESFWLDKKLLLTEYKSMHKFFLNKFNYPYFEILNSKRVSVKNHLTLRAPTKLYSSNSIGK